ncbi:hypothetical protein WMY93_010532 [Mugilogobius chulae]|uniref:Protein kinase domain-containing protein n=1 Tax=Mugilogobius chulae TaxID=88201 RepID=A0AAW0PK50_9GOBI
MSTYGCGCAAQCKYKVLQLLGEGSCGKVAKGRNRYTKELVALKVQKKGMHEDYFYKKELENLDLIRPLDPDTFNLIRFIEHFEFKSHRCLAFELLDQSVLEHLNKCDISLNQMRPMAKQLLVSLFGLKSVGLMHTDIKLDNIMLVDQEKQPFKLKLIDFGVAKHRDRVRPGSILQPLGYRSPEVVLGLPLGESVDMWSLACCLATCFKVGYVFPCGSEFDLLTKIVKFLGKPPDELLNQAMYSKQYFVQEKSKWRLKTPQEYKKSSGENLRIVADTLGNTTLQKLIKHTFRHNSCSEFTDREAFYDLLKRMFELDPLKRITPAEALLHPFITMEHLPPSEDYTQEAHDLMKVAQTDHVDLQTENLKKAAQCEEKKRAEALLSRPSAPPQPAPQPIVPDKFDNTEYTEQSTYVVTDLEAERVPRSTFGRFVPRALREFWSRLRQSTRTNRPVLPRSPSPNSPSLAEHDVMKSDLGVQDQIQDRPSPCLSTLKTKIRPSPHVLKSETKPRPSKRGLESSLKTKIHLKCCAGESSAPAACPHPPIVGQIPRMPLGQLLTDMSPFSLYLALGAGASGVRGHAEL